MPQQLSISTLKVKCRQILSHPLAAPVIILLVIIGRIVQQVYFFNTRSDMSYQVLGAHYLLNGHGISAASITAADISQVTYLPLNNWPPGFSLLFTPFYLLCGQDYIAAGIALGITAAVLLIFILRGIVRLLGVPPYLVNLFTLLSGFFGYYFYTMPCTDAVAVTFFAAAFYFALKILQKKGSLPVQLTGLILSLLSCGFIKYLYMPAMFVIPAYLVVSGMINKESTIKRAGLITGFAILVITGMFLFSQQKNTGTVGFIKETKRGFYPENLQSAFPFVTAAFSRPDTVEYITGKSKLVNVTLQFITIAACLAIFIWYVKRSKKYRLREHTAAGHFYHLAIGVSVAIIALLAVLSLRVGKETFDFGKWTYVQEPRYYGFIVILIQLAAVALFASGATRISATAQLIFPLVFILFSSEAVRGVIFTGNRLMKLNRETYGWQQELQFQQQADKVVQQLQQRYPSAPVIITGSADWMLLRVSLYSHLPIFTAVQQLNTAEEIKTSKPAVLLAMLKEEESAGFKSFISLANVKEEGTAGGFHFYSMYINP